MEESDEEEGEKEEEEDEDEQSDDGVSLISQKIPPASDQELMPDIKVGTLENCYAAKAFAWNALGKLFSSSDVDIIKKHFNEAPGGKVKLWELFHHGIKYSKEQLGISPNVMKSYADRIFSWMN